MHAPYEKNERNRPCAEAGDWRWRRWRREERGLGRHGAVGGLAGPPRAALAAAGRPGRPPRDTDEDRGKGGERGMPAIQMSPSAAPWARLLLIASCALAVWRCGAQDANVFRAGAVLTGRGHGSTEEMQEAREGYELFTDLVNEKNGGRGFRVRGRDGVELFFKFRFVSREDEGSKKRHQRELEDLLHGEEAVHFVYGSHPEFAEGETKACQDAGRLNYHCCVGPDEIYMKGYKYVFGIPSSNTRYTELTLTKMALKNLTRLAVIYREDNPFTRTTCESAIEFATERFRKGSAQFNIMMVERFNRTKLQEEINRNNPDGPLAELEAEKLRQRFRRIARKAEKKGVESVVACAFNDDGQMMVEAFNEREYPLKSLFLTVGPTKLEWLHKTRNSAYILSAVQWHNKLKSTSAAGSGHAGSLEDPVFGNPKSYSIKYNSVYKKPPTYVSAGASAVGLTLKEAIHDALTKCDIGFSSGNVDELLFGPPLNCSDDSRQLNGYERVRLELEALDMFTFYGQVKFNEHRRNAAKDPVTTQALGPDKKCAAIGEESYLGLEAVLPVDTATRELKMPACNPFRKTCPPGTKVPIDSFQDCELCSVGTFSENTNSDRCNICAGGQYNDKTGQMECKECPLHTTSQRNSTKLSDCGCEEGFFHPSAKSGEQCEVCPLGATCEGNAARPNPIPGYWVDKDAKTITTVYECPLRSACLGDGECKAAHTGRKCRDCIEGYFRASHRCQKCPGLLLLIFLFIALMVGWYLIIVVAVKNLPSVEIFILWMQLANIIGELDLRWPLRLETVFTTANIMDFDVDTIELTCFYPLWCYKDNFLLQMSLPLILGLVSLSRYLVAKALWVFLRDRDLLRLRLARLIGLPRTRSELDARWDTTISTFLSSVDVTWLTIAKYTFNSFKCGDVHGVSVLLASPYVECESNTHDIIRAQAGVGLFVYVIGFPVFVAYTLYSLHLRQAFSDPVVLRRYGFLYRRFEQNYFWTGVVILLRRILFVLVLVFVNNAAFQAATMAAITIGSLMLHIYSSPYVDSYLDWLTDVLLISLLIQCLGGVMFYATNLPDANRSILELFVLGGLFLLVLCFAIALMWELRYKIGVMRLRRLHCRGVVCKDLSQCPLKKYKGEVGKALLRTFNPHFVHGALTKTGEEMLLRWDKLSDMLENYLAESSETSYLSASPIACFWRKLVKRFPELIDMLAVADPTTRSEFKDFVTTLYNDFYLRKHVEIVPIFRVVNWRDRAPLAQWLAMAQENELVFFRELVADMYRAQSPLVAEAMERKILEGSGSDTSDAFRKGTGSWSLHKVFMDKFSGILDDKGQVLKEINGHRGPLRHTAKVLTITSTEPSTEGRGVSYVSEGAHFLNNSETDTGESIVPVMIEGVEGNARVLQLSCTGNQHRAPRPMAKEPTATTAAGRSTEGQRSDTSSGTHYVSCSETDSGKSMVGVERLEIEVEPNPHGYPSHRGNQRDPQGQGCKARLVGNSAKSSTRGWGSSESVGSNNLKYSEVDVQDLEALQSFGCARASSLESKPRSQVVLNSRSDNEDSVDVSKDPVEHKPQSFEGLRTAGQGPLCLADEGPPYVSRTLRGGHSQGPNLAPWLYLHHN
eukprot:evm.model.scf_1223.3 EVM.evm.TU.scf_1223.3   scf_1223:28111-38337(+)